MIWRTEDVNLAEDGGAGQVVFFGSDGLGVVYIQVSLHIAVVQLYSSSSLHWLLPSSPPSQWLHFAFLKSPSGFTKWAHKGLLSAWGGIS